MTDTIHCDGCFAVATIDTDEWDDADDLRPHLPEGWTARDVAYVMDTQSWDGERIETVVLCPRCQEMATP